MRDSVHQSASAIPAQRSYSIPNCVASKSQRRSRFPDTPTIAGVGFQSSARNDLVVSRKGRADMHLGNSGFPLTLPTTCFAAESR